MNLLIALAFVVCGTAIMLAVIPYLIPLIDKYFEYVERVLTRKEKKNG